MGLIELISILPFNKKANKVSTSKCLGCWSIQFVVCPFFNEVVPHPEVQKLLAFCWNGKNCKRFYLLYT